jgi:hypothetical protein
MGLHTEYLNWKNSFSSDCELEEDTCVCRGRGWVLSPFDTWHPCPQHYGLHPHPEEEYGFDIEVQCEMYLVVRNHTKQKVYHTVLKVGSDRFEHFFQFASREEALRFGKKIIQDPLIADKVYNRKYWTNLSEYPEHEHH